MSEKQKLYDMFGEDAVKAITACGIDVSINEFSGDKVRVQFTLPVLENSTYSFCITCATGKPLAFVYKFLEEANCFDPEMFADATAMLKEDDGEMPYDEAYNEVFVYASAVQETFEQARRSIKDGVLKNASMDEIMDEMFPNRGINKILDNYGITVQFNGASTDNANIAEFLLRSRIEFQNYSFDFQFSTACDGSHKELLAKIQDHIDNFDPLRIGWECFNDPNNQYRLGESVGRISLRTSADGQASAEMFDYAAVEVKARFVTALSEIRKEFPALFADSDKASKSVTSKRQDDIER